MGEKVFSVRICEIKYYSQCGYVREGIFSEDMGDKVFSVWICERKCSQYVRYTVPYVSKRVLSEDT